MQSCDTKLIVGFDMYNLKIKRFLFLIIALLFLCSPFIYTFNNLSAAALKGEIEILESCYDLIDSRSKDGILFTDDFLSGAGGSASDWLAFLAGRLGLGEDYNLYLSFLRQSVEQRYRQTGLLDRRKATEWHRISLTTLSVGGDPMTLATNSQGDSIDLIADGTYLRPKDAPLSAQGSNAYIWALITVDSIGYKLPQGTRENIISNILKYRSEDGGFSLNRQSSDTDITAMALTALSPYENNEREYIVSGSAMKLRDIISDAVGYLSQSQSESGGFKSMGVENSSSISQVIVALCSLGIDPIEDDRFIKPNGNILDALFSYRTDDGRFKHINTGKSDGIADEQALSALVALYRFKCGYRSLYDLRLEQSEELKAEIANLNKDINAQPLNLEKAEVEKLFTRYKKIPPTERRYVFAYSLLATFMEELGIDNTIEPVEEYMDITSGGAGSVADIIGAQVEEQLFTQQDKNLFYALSEQPTTKDKVALSRLIAKLENAKNKDSYNDLLIKMRNKKTQIEAIEREIIEIGEEIFEKISPLENKSNDKTLINSLLKRTQVLLEYDRQQIKGYDDLLYAKAKLRADEIELLVKVLGVVLFIILLIIFLYRIRIRKNKKHR